MKLKSEFESLFNKTKAVLFDLDGSLMDSMWMWKDIDIQYLRKFNIECPDDLQKNIEGLSVVETAVYFQNTFGIKDSVSDILEYWNMMAFDKYSNEVALKPGAGEFLKFCAERKIKLGICSSNTKQLLEAVLVSNKVKDLFEIVISGEDVNKGKPNPECYLTAAGILGVEPENCLVFEDIPMGIEAGLNANMTVFAVEDDYSKHYKNQKMNMSHYFINDYTELFED